MTITGSFLVLRHASVGFKLCKGKSLKSVLSKGKSLFLKKDIHILLGFLFYLKIKLLNPDDQWKSLVQKVWGGWERNALTIKVEGTAPAE